MAQRLEHTDAESGLSLALPTLQEKLDQLPAAPGVYLMKDIAADVIYVGKAASLRSRVRSYFQPGAELHPRTASLVSQVSDLDFIVANSEQEALVLEFSLIQRHQPRFNVRYRDDKSYPYLRVDLREPFPSLCVVRQYLVVNDGARYFGPYPSTRAMWQTIGMVRRLFRVSQKLVASAKKRGGCTWEFAPGAPPRRRPCLDYYVKRCLAPCAGEVTQEEYGRAVSRACRFLSGKHETVLRELRREMEQASADLRFEAAGRIRDQVQAIESVIGAEQRVVSGRREDLDAVGHALREDTACVAVLQVREGKLVGQDQVLLDGVSGVAEEEVLNEFIKHYYQKAATPPRSILLPAPIADASAVEALLTGRRESPAKVLAPRRGDKRKLVEMAVENAEQHLRAVLERESAEKRRGEEAVADLRKVLALPMAPRRIEAFDISNVQGKQAVGSMVVFEEGLPKKSDYRRFRIRLGEGEPNDYAMMEEVLSRRLKAAVSGNVRFQRLPDLMLVDGGVGQLNMARKAMGALGLRIPVASLAKEQEMIYLPDRSSPLALPAHSRALHLLQRLRDEAHRFALAYHRGLRAKAARESVLEVVPGIGPARRKRLISHFSTISRLRQATVEQVAAAAGCSAAVAAAVLAAVSERGAAPAQDDERGPGN